MDINHKLSDCGANRKMNPNQIQVNFMCQLALKVIPLCQTIQKMLLQSLQLNLEWSRLQLREDEAKLELTCTRC